MFLLFVSGIHWIILFCRMQQVTKAQTLMINFVNQQWKVYVHVPLEVNWN